MNYATSSTGEAYRIRGDTNADVGANLNASLDQGFLILASASLTSAVTETVSEVGVLAQALEVRLGTSKLAGLGGAQHALAT